MIHKRIDLTAALLEQELRGLGYPRGAKFHGRVPEIILLGDGVSYISGRYFPSRNAILVVRHEDGEVTRALVLHELAHAYQYERRCGGTSKSVRKKCGYVGQHDPEFYRDLERMHRAKGVPLRAAVVVERESGYAYPVSWDRGRW
jgi:hypothetical protein